MQAKRFLESVLMVVISLQGIAQPGLKPGYKTLIREALNISETIGKKI